jgi:hypothetical protein
VPGLLPASGIQIMLKVTNHLDVNVPPGMTRWRPSSRLLAQLGQRAGERS